MLSVCFLEPSLLPCLWLFVESRSICWCCMFTYMLKSPLLPWAEISRFPGGTWARKKRGSESSWHDHRLHTIIPEHLYSATRASQESWGQTEQTQGASRSVSKSDFEPSITDCVLRIILHILNWRGRRNQANKQEDTFCNTDRRRSTTCEERESGSLSSFWLAWWLLVFKNTYCHISIVSKKL